MSTFIAANAGSNPPWWGIPIFTLGGTLLGGILTQLFARFNANSATRQSIDIQRQNVARDSMVKFLSEVHRAFIFMRESHTTYVPEPVNLAWADLQISADPEVIKGGRIYLNKLNLIAIEIRATGQLSDVDRNAYDIARIEFIRLARHKGGLGEPPTLDEIVRYTDPPQDE